MAKTTNHPSRSHAEHDEALKRRRQRPEADSKSDFVSAAPDAGEQAPSAPRAADPPPHEYRQPDTPRTPSPPQPGTSPSWPSNVGGPSSAGTSSPARAPASGGPAPWAQVQQANALPASAPPQVARPMPVGHNLHQVQPNSQPGQQQQQQQQQQQGRPFAGGSMQQAPGVPGQGGGRRKKKKKRGAGGGSGTAGGGPPVQQMVAQGMLPSDEEIEREAQALERIAGTPDYAEAEKNALHMSELQRMEIGKLHLLAEQEGLAEPYKYPRQELIFHLLKKKAAESGLIFGEGTLDIAPEGYGFLRSPEQSYLHSPDDIYVAPAMIRRMALRRGMEIKGAIRPPRDNEKFFTLLRIDSINGRDPAEARRLPIFEDLTPLHPEQRFVLETTPDEIEMRIVDLVAPIGRGQRGLIVAPPRTGKTVLLQKITQAISKNYPDVKIIVLLIDERPEEVTDFRRNTAPTVEVVASTFDEDASRHVAVAEMVIEKARRYVEYGQHCVILLDSITRLARAYNAAQPHSGKIMTGGIDSNALVRPKKFFGSARAIEHGGSLTILGTALVDTGSKADEVIFEEFKGTGNSELHLDRKLVDKRIWPAIDVAASGTRREELLLDKKELELTYRLRKVLSDMNVVEAMELLKSRLKKCKTNAEFLLTMNLGA